MTNSPKAENLEATPRISSSHASYPYERPIQGGYFMDDNARFAVLGEALENQKKTSEEIKALRLEALSRGARLESLGRMLRDKPESVVFDGQSFSGAIEPAFSILPTDLDWTRIKTLTDTLRTELSKQKVANALLETR